MVARVTQVQCLEAACSSSLDLEFKYCMLSNENHNNRMIIPVTHSDLLLLHYNCYYLRQRREREREGAHVL